MAEIPSGTPPRITKVTSRPKNIGTLPGKPVFRATRLFTEDDALLRPHGYFPAPGESTRLCIPIARDGHSSGGMVRNHATIASKSACVGHRDTEFGRQTKGKNSSIRFLLVKKRIFLNKFIVLPDLTATVPPAPAARARCPGSGAP